MTWLRQLRPRAHKGRLTPAGVVCALFCLGLVGLPASLAAQPNLLTNPSLDTNLSGWDFDAAVTTFDGTRGDPAPGSARWTTTLSDESTTEDALIIGQCVEGIVAGGTYEFGGRLLLASAPEGATGNVVIAWQSSPGCSGNIGVVAATPVSSPEVWGSASGSVVAPAGAVSVEVLVVSGTTAFGPGSISPEGITIIPGSYEVNADSLYLRLMSEPVPTMGTVWMIVLAIGLVLVATRALSSFGRTTA